jgi:protein-S-isoprenylcysteine O-methyltransferase Ste14
MSASFPSQSQLPQLHADTLTSVGGWLFRRRTIIPLPLALAVLLTPNHVARGPILVAAGLALVVLGEGLRLWGVHHIGVISRTRSDRLGPLVASGPFALVRNPLYLGNIALWVGFAVTAGLVWLAPVFVAVLAFEYHAIVRWEERLLDQRLGESYRLYAVQVPRWVPRLPDRRGVRAEPRNTAASAGPAFSWGDTAYSERGTLIAIAVGFVLLWAKTRV